MLLTLPIEVFYLDWFSIYSLGLQRSLAHVKMESRELLNAVPASLEALGVNLQPEVIQYLTVMCILSNLTH